jgi:hypothetical protein
MYCETTTANTTNQPLLLPLSLRIEIEGTSIAVMDNHTQVLWILFAAALLIFFSSFVTLDHHPQPVADKATLLARSRLPIQPQPSPNPNPNPNPSQNVNTLSTLPLPLPLPLPSHSVDGDQRDRTTRDMSLRDAKQRRQQQQQQMKTKTQAQSLETVAHNVLTTSSFTKTTTTTTTMTTTGLSTATAKRWAADDPQRCRARFSTNCSVSRWVHYWDDETDCFSSPLRARHGLQAPLRQRKFVVFQPDLGGWNK